VTAAASKVGANRREVYRRIGEFSQLLAPVGLGSAQGVPSGWLRVLHDEIGAFGHDLATTSTGCRDAAIHLAAIADAARRTARLSDIVFRMLDYAVLDIVGTIRRWDAEAPVLRQSIERLSLMLDEWPTLMKMTRDALRTSPEEAIAQLRVLGSTLPRVPESEASSDASAPSISDVLGTRLATIQAMLGVRQSVDA
jgi:hypothetical protein